MTLGDLPSDYPLTGIRVSDSVTTANLNSISNGVNTQLENFENQFEEKYKVKFEDFVEVLMRDYPELKV